MSRSNSSKAFSPFKVKEAEQRKVRLRKKTKYRPDVLDGDGEEGIEALLLKFGDELAKRGDERRLRLEFMEGAKKRGRRGEGEKMIDQQQRDRYDFFYQLQLLAVAALRIAVEKKIKDKARKEDHEFAADGGHRLPCNDPFIHPHISCMPRQRQKRRQRRFSSSREVSGALERRRVKTAMLLTFRRTGLVVWYCSLMKDDDINLHHQQ
nr:unnamed protein product [Digitaria exilis]